MNTFNISSIRNLPSEIAQALTEGPVMITRHGEPFGILLHPDEYQLLYEVAEIARDPEQYKRFTEPAPEGSS